MNPRKHYGLKSGMVSLHGPADFITVEDLTDFKVKDVYVIKSGTAHNVYQLVEVMVKYPIVVIESCLRLVLDRKIADDDVYVIKNATSAIFIFIINIIKKDIDL